MIAYLAYCDRRGAVERVVRATPGILPLGAVDVHELFENARALDALLDLEPEASSSAALSTTLDGPSALNIALRSFEDIVLVFAYHLDDEADLPRVAEFALNAFATPGMLGLEPHGSEYFEIQRLNSKLVNSQRTISKTNAQLKKLLEDARAAKSAIEVLERDSLTGLLTEKAFQERARVLIEGGSSAKLDVVALDVERFKIVNETFGTNAGDQLLMSIAGAIEEQEKPLLITRARADTFFMLKERAEGSYERMSDRLAAFLSEYPLPMRLQAKLGVYQIDEKPPDVARICDRALMAAESVKNDYNNDLALYDASMRKQMITEQNIVNTMVESIEREDFYVVLQPKVEVATQRVIGAEALVRWNHPDLGAVSPKDFIPTFEKNGFVHTLDCYVWEKACGMLERWRGTGNAVPLSVNVSRADLYREDLAELLADMVRSHRLEPADLHLEITETVFVEDSGQPLAAVNRLKRAGFVIEMDDFGSGYSSLNALADLPVDVLKLDMGFLRRTDRPERKHAIMRSIIGLAGQLDMQVIAEGVETEGQASLLASMGCRFAQGYLYGRPMAEGAFLEHLPRP